MSSERKFLERRRRWRQGDAVTVESYLEENPELRGSSEAALELIASEISLRSERGETPPFQEYSGRFPEYAAQLGRRYRARMRGEYKQPR